jgi:two-component system response regulator QseB
LLLAEDHQLVRELIVSVLQGLGYAVCAVETGPALLEHARQQRAAVRLLIVDVELPGRNGLDCLRDLRSLGVAVPAIVITAESDASLADELDGDAVLLRKPFDMQTLGTLVRELLDADTQEKSP